MNVDGKKVALVIFEDGQIKQVGSMNVGKCLLDASAALMETTRSIDVPFSGNGEYEEIEVERKNKKEIVSKQVSNK